MKSSSNLKSEVEEKLVSWSKSINFAQSVLKEADRGCYKPSEIDNRLQYAAVWENSQQRPARKNDSGNYEMERTNGNTLEQMNGKFENRLPFFGMDSVMDEVEKDITYFTSLFISNLSNIVRTKQKLRFFKLKLTYSEVIDSLYDNGLLTVNKPLYHVIEKYDTANKFLLIISEENGDINNNQSTLLGVAKIMQMSDDESQAQIRVDYLSLAFSNIGVGKCNPNHVPSVLQMLRSYLNDIIKGSVELFLPNEIIFSNDKSPLNASGVEDRKNIDELNSDNDKMNSNFPVLKNLLPDEQVESWFQWEYKNLEEISDWSETSFIICDMLVDDVKQCVLNHGKLYIDDTNKMIINEEIEKSKYVYLIFRKHSYNSEDAKHVFGIALVVGVYIENICLQFLCLSRAQYVSHPWCDEESFTSGQVFNLKEDARILLEEYKMSLRVKRAKPIFDDIYPWSERKENDQRKPEESEAKTSQNVKNDAIGGCNETLTAQGTGHTRSRSKRFQPRLNNTKSPPKPRESNSPPHSPIREVAPRFSKNRRRAICVASNLLNLRASAKLLSRDTWVQLEIKNLERLKHDCNARNEFYIAITNLNEIKKSIKNGKLNVSERNIENLGGSSRNKKYVFLKAKIDVSHGCAFTIVGIATVDRISEIEINEHGNGFMLPISYIALSLPRFNETELTKQKYGDGIEVTYNVAQTYTNTYIVELKQGNVDVLLDHVYPWCPNPPTTAKFVDNTPPSKTVCAPSVHTELCIDETEVDNLGDHLKSSDVSDKPTFTFADIRRDLSENSDNSKTHNPYFDPSSEQFLKLRSKFNMEMEAEARNTSFLVESSQTPGLFTTRSHSESSAAPKRSGGRGKLLMKQAASFGRPRQSSWR